MSTPHSPTAVRAAVLTVSDRSAAGERPDTSGPELEKLALAQGWVVAAKRIVPDDGDRIRETLLEWANSGQIDLILTTGGTGFAPRDVTPEATQAVIERPAPGLAEAIRQAALRITPHAMLSRGVTGICQHTLIVNLPGSPRAAVENLEVIVSVIPHAIQLLRDEPGSEAGHRMTA